MVRPARVEDAGQIALVHVRSWQGAYRGLIPQAFLDGLDVAQRTRTWERALAETDNPRAGVLVADDGGSVVGFVGYFPSRDPDADPDLIGEIGAIYVLPGAWGGGSGRRLMEAALGRLAGAGFTQVTLWVLDSNDRARRFYEAGGWSADGAAKQDDSRGFPLSEVRYRRSLSSLS
ncbi:GNAT family N-acetyltransferase [Trebonia kvetii]|uniref:GNAT family N-acetyltransferase n=2 Tax=Trebonia kvetii TaxID=2480626 RepID=A0A6P2BNI9_9ACTN|nr:GNAT family N-acetyltransferase [Trebonia kvetii]